MTESTLTGERLQEFHLFSSLTKNEADVLVPHFREVIYDAGQTIIQQDEISSHLFLIAAGIAEVRLPLVGPRGTTSVAKFGPRECIGELAMAKIARRAASAVAEVECRCFVADVARLTESFEKNPKIGFEVYRKLATIMTDRLVATNMMLRNSESNKF
jgi:CRP-like cAMP-binding protein